MKKIICFLLAGILVLFLCSCKREEAVTNEESLVPKATQGSEPSGSTTVVTEETTPEITQKYEPKINIPFSEVSIIEFVQNLIYDESTEDFDLEMELSYFDGDLYGYNGDVQIVRDDGGADEDSRCFVRLLCKKPGTAKGEVQIDFYENTYNLSHEVYKIKVTGYCEKGGDQYTVDIACLLMSFLSGGNWHLEMTGERYDWMQYTCVGRYVNPIRAEFFIWDENLLTD